MPSLSQDQPGPHLLRFVFERSAPLLRFVPEVTSGDIARIWREMADLRPEPPVAIDVTFASNSENPSKNIAISMGWLPRHFDWGGNPEE